MRKCVSYVVAMVRLVAPNDRNGNPRRAFVALGPFGDVVGAWNEGYAGTHAVPEALRYLAGRAEDVPSTPRGIRWHLRKGVHASARFFDASARLRRNILRAGTISGRGK